MIKNPVAQAHARRRLPALVQILVDRVAPGEHDAGNQNLVADLQRADFFSENGKLNFIM